MRAVVIRSTGGPEVLVVADVPVPEPGPGQVRVATASAAVNPVDVANRAGLLAGIQQPRAERGLGWDVAGVVEKVGPGVADLRPGDEVVGIADRLDVPLGTHAEYVVLDRDNTAPAPRGADLVAAATLPLKGWDPNTAETGRA